jgi:hypothetical protein
MLLRRRALRLRTVAAEAFSFGGGQNPLPCQVPDQVKEQWCWAAVSAGVKNLYCSKTLRPCDIASDIFNSPCCDDPSSCNDPMFLANALDRLGMLVQPIEGQLKIDQIAAQIDTGRPVCCFIDYGLEVGHFIVISGYVNGSSAMVAVLDPAPGGPHDAPQFLPFSSFQMSYGKGVWTETYRTQKPEAC